MPLHVATLERQLERAKEDLTTWIRTLDGQGVAATARRKNAKWRHLNAVYNSIRKRMKASVAVLTRDEAVAQHKIEKLAAATEEKAPKKAAKEHKPKEPKAKDKNPVKKEKGEKGAESKDKKKKDKEKG